MIDTSGNKQSVWEQATLVKFYNESGALPPSEIQERNKEIQKVARVSHESHKAALEYLDQQFNQQLVQQGVVEPAKQAEQAGVLSATEQQSDKQAGVLSATEQQSDQQAGVLSATEQQSDKQAGVLSASEQQSSEQAVVLSASEQKTANEQAIALASIEMAATEESKRAKLEKLAEKTAGTGTLSPDSDVEFYPHVVDPNVDDGFTFPLLPPPPIFPPGYDKQSLFNGGLDPKSILTEISLRFGASMRDAVEKRIEANKELNTQSSALQQAVIEQKTDEQIEQLEKAEHASKAGNCITILVTVAVTLLSFALAVVTGGAASALVGLAIGMTLLVVDQIMTAAGSKSLTAMILDPVMQNVIMPVIQWIMDGITDLLVEAGMDKEKAQIAGLVLAMIAVVLVVAIAIIGAKNSSILSNMSSKLGTLFSNIGSKITPNFVKEGAKAFGTFATNFMAKAGSRVTDKAAQRATSSALARGVSEQAAEEAGESAAAAALRGFMDSSKSLVERGMLVTSGIGIVGASGAGVASGAFRMEAEFAFADMQELMERMLLESEDLQKFIEQLREAYAQVNSLMNLAFDEQKGTSNTAKMMLNNIAIGV